MADPDLRPDPLTQHQRQDLTGEEADGNVGMDLLEDFSHLRHICSGGVMRFLYHKGRALHNGQFELSPDRIRN